jgi:NAD+ diphosphatase
MLGFEAEALTTELSFKDGELAEARWFSRDDYRQAIEQGEVVSAPGISISLRLIEHWYGGALPVPPPH